MGFSVSGATAVILLGMLIAFGFVTTTAINGHERVSAAHDDRADRLLDQQNTAVEIANATYNESGNEAVAVTVNNTGTTTLSVEETSLLVDGEYVADAMTDVDGEGNTDVWNPGEQLTITTGEPSAPDRVKVVTEVGVSALETEVIVVG